MVGLRWPCRSPSRRRGVPAWRSGDRLVGLTLAALFAALAADAATTGTLANEDLGELSGLAVSRADAAVLWGHNDSGAGPALYRIGLQGEDLGRVPVAEALSGDWEDLAAFTDRSGPALLIGDVGDNLGLRSFSTLYAVRDPGRARAASVLWRLDFSFPDGMRDCEAIAVDPLSREILLLTKRDRPARLYRLPLPERAPKTRQVAQFLGTVAPFPEVPLGQRLRSPVDSQFLHVPTALDISADGLTAVIVTLSNAYVFRRRPEQAWIGLFAQGTAPIPLPPDLQQVEAAALSADGRTLYLGSEGRPGRWARLALP